MVERSPRIIWETALGELQLQVSKANYRTWLEKTVGLGYENGEFIIGVPNAFVAEYLDKNQRSLIERTLIGLAGPEVKVNFKINGLTTRPTREAVPPSGTRLNPRYTFETFIAGERNRLAREAALQVAHNPGLVYNPLLIYGGTGLGKTHLLHAIGHIALAQNAHILVASAEQYLSEFVTSVREGTNEDFQNRYRSVDILLIDDIQTLAGKKETQESFFHTFNELHSSHKQIVMTSDRPPKSLEKLEERLCSRFEWGLTANITPPNREMRLEIVKEKAREESFELDPAVFEVIARKDYANIRELEGALNRVRAFSALVQARPTPEMAARALEDITGKAERTLTPAGIIAAVAASFQLSAEDLRGKKRDRETTLARHVAMYLIRKQTGCSLVEIGRALGDRDHSTVVHGCWVIENSLESSPYLQRKLHEIRQSEPFRQ